MRVAVFGLGYVGSVTAACLARLGHDVVGVDVDGAAVAALAAARAPVREPGLDRLVASALAENRLRVTANAAEAIAAAEVCLVCVPTPGGPGGRPELGAVREAAATIGRALRRGAGRPVVLVRSTLLPGGVEEVVVPTIEAASGRERGRGFGYGANPEFMREGRAVADFLSPPFVLIGAGDGSCRRAGRALYRPLGAPLVVTGVREAELAKHASNAFHALKVAFANEIARLGAAFGADGRKVMAVVARDRRLNASSAYMRPGLPYGGSCLPKDLAALVAAGRQAQLDLPVLCAVGPSNDLELERAMAMVRAAGPGRVGIVGIAFKAGTDDLRGSPLLAIAAQLRREGREVAVFDPEVRPGRLGRASREAAAALLPELKWMLVPSLGALVEFSDVLVVGRRVAALGGALASRGRSLAIVDLVGALGGGAPARGRVRRRVRPKPEVAAREPRPVAPLAAATVTEEPC